MCTHRGTERDGTDETRHRVADRTNPVESLKHFLRKLFPSFKTDQVIL